MIGLTKCKNVSTLDLHTSDLRYDVHISFASLISQSGGWKVDSLGEKGDKLKLSVNCGDGNMFWFLV